MTDSKKISQKTEADFSVFANVRGRGRPKDAALRQRILERARDLFLEHGFQTVAMDLIATAAEVSNRTVYSHFESKERLLAAVLQFEGERLRPRFPEVEIRTKTEFVAGLQAFGERLVGLLTNPSIVGLGRIMISESGRHPEMARQFYEWGPKQTEKLLIQFLDVGRTSGWCQFHNSSLSAAQLLALWQGTWLLKQQLGLEKKLSPAKIKRHVEDSLKVFFDGVLS
jgi:TetR/AcrR family transcriptional regulator, mexJK operon transcriptional repressor